MADELEINEQSTPEEVAAYAEQVVNEVQTERAGETKSDAQITAEHGTMKQPSDKTSPAEPNSGSDTTAEVEDQSEESGSKEASWLDDDLKAAAAAYGINESDLADFASREEFEKALRIFDKTALDAGRKALAAEGEGDTGRERNEKGQYVKKDEPEPPKRDGRYEVTLDTDIYDDEIVAEFNRMRDHYDSRVAALEARFAETDALAEEQRFDGFVDSLGHTDLFGKTGSESPEEIQRRQDLMVAVKAQQIGLQQLGRPTELNEFLVNRVARMVFAEELGKKDLKQRTRKISRQSNARQGGGATRPQDPREDPRDEFDRLYRQLDRA
jgi:hypothetical protein